MNNYDNSMVTLGNAFKSSLTNGTSRKEKKGKDESESKFEDDLNELEEFLARRLSRGKVIFKGKLPLICFKCNEVSHIASRCPNKRSSDKNYKRENK